MASQPEIQKQHSISLLHNWRLISDQVMGGRSSGRFAAEQSGQYFCLHLQGSVTTENNGGFLQIAHDLSEPERLAASLSTGIRMLARGNNESYNLHLRTSNLSLPWQSFRSSFHAVDEWREIVLPFDQFSAYKTSSKLDIKKIRRIGILAIGRDFEADVKVTDFGFY